LSERSGTLADDPFGGRRPTSQERLTGLPWDASYHDGAAPWDVGRPQPAVVRVASEGGFTGVVLDAGCGTGENALHLASLGLSVLGVDVAETALAIARAKADERGIEVEFAAADALQLERLGRRFATVLDCGLFHTFDGGERPGYVASLASVTEHAGTVYVWCFRDDGPDTGPAPRQPGTAAGGVQPQQWVGGGRHRTGPASDQIPRRRRTGLVRDNQTDLIGRRCMACMFARTRTVSPSPSATWSVIMWWVTGTGRSSRSGRSGLTSRTVSSSAATRQAIAGTGVPAADAMIIIARRTRIDSCLPRRVICRNRRLPPRSTAAL
jgi:SAM-dependent methyltransferase